MDCETAIERMGDGFDGKLGAVQRAELEAHLEACVSCRAASESLTPLWKLLEAERVIGANVMSATPVGDPEQRRRRRIELLLEAWRIGASERAPATAAPATTAPAARASRRRPILQLAAALVLGALAGNLLPWRLSAATDRDESPSAPAESGREFLLALHERPSTSPPDPAEVRRLVAEYTAWAGELARAEHLVSAEKLRDDARTILRPRADGVEIDASFPAPDESWLSGFFLLRARDLAEAIDLARASPHLRYGGEIEVREIDRER